LKKGTTLNIMQIDRYNMNNILNYSEFIGESKKTSGFTEFAGARLAGATNITEMAKEKGGAALLTWHHFRVKLPYYKKAAAGKFNREDAIKELRDLNSELSELLKTFETKDQIPFQKVMGKIEVLGELIIESVSNI
jgi:hypothetical protein